MSDNSYKVILLGQIADGFDPAEVKEKLALIFEKSEKKINKLFKKKPAPIVIRKNLTQEVALRYKMGMEKIGVLCEIRNGGMANVGSSTPPVVVNTTADSQAWTTGLPKGVTFGLENGNIRVTAVKIPFWSFIFFLVKLTFASIPAFIIMEMVSIELQQGIEIVIEMLEISR